MTKTTERMGQARPRPGTRRWATRVARPRKPRPVPYFVCPFSLLLFMPAPSVSPVLRPAATVAANPGWAVYAAETHDETGLETGLAAASARPPAPRLPLAFEPWLFARPAHQALQGNGGGRVLGVFLENVALGRTVGAFYARLDAGNRGGHSPGQAPFGGLQLADDLPAERVRWFVEIIETELLRRDIQRLVLRPPAFAYAPTASALQAEILRLRGYRTVLVEQN